MTQLLPVQKNGKYAYIDENGHLKTEFIYDEADDFYEGIAIVRNEAYEKWAINENFEELFVVPEECAFYSNGLMQIRIEDKCGYMDKNGEIAIKPIYDTAYDFEYGYALAGTDDKLGVIDTEGTQLIGAAFDSLSDVTEDGITVFGITKRGNDWLYGLINVKHEKVIPEKFSYPISYNEKLLTMQNDDNKYGYADIHEKWIIRPKFQDACSFENGTAPVSINDKWGIIDKNGSWLITPEYITVRHFREELAAVYIGGRIIDGTPKGGKWGFVNMKGKIAIHAIYDDVYLFRGGICKVEIESSGNTKTGYIDINGNYIWEPSS